MHSSLFLRFTCVVSVALLAVGLHIGHGRAQQSATNQPVQIVNGYPEFNFYGQPFFPHSTAFFYNRLPRSEWAASLIKLKELGINTIDLYLAWNWHEPEEGKLDFDGHTNPRRDVKGLLEMLDAMGFAVIARPGPVILNEWRNGGYPDWLLKRPEYQMNETARLDGHYPPLSGLSPSNSEEASRQWLVNETHLRYTRKWFGEVMRELLRDRQATNGGNVIAIQLDDDQAINRANYNGPLFWRYMNTLAGYLREAGATVPLYINPTDMRISAAGAQHDIGAMGQWYFNFGSDPALRWEDTAVLQFYTETLKTQPHFPPMLIEYQAGWYGTGDDTYAKTADPSNTLLSSRVLIGHGLKGLNYFPVQDTLYPAGYEVPWANHYYTWESALNLAGQERPRAAAVQRNGRLIAGLGRELAGMHKAADIGLVYPISSFDQAALTRDDVLRVSRATMQIQQYCQLNQVAVEYLDLEFQPLEHLQRHKALLLPVFDEESLAKTAAQGREEISAANEPTGRRSDTAGQVGKLQLSKLAQQKLVDYVKAGGKLICSPRVPQGELIGQLAGRANVIVMPDWWREMPLEIGKAKREEMIAQVKQSAFNFTILRARTALSGMVSATVTMEGDPIVLGARSMEPNFVATELVTDQFPLSSKQIANDELEAKNRRFGFVSVLNFDERKAMRVRMSVADPREKALGSVGTGVDIPAFTLAAREAMLLPVQLPLENGGERVRYATAELIRREVANGRIKMRFYSPHPAEVELVLPRAPQGAVTIDGVPAQANFNKELGRLKIKIAPLNNVRLEESDRLANEHDVEIDYEQAAVELNVKKNKLIVGDMNQVTVEINNRSNKALSGKLNLWVQNGLKQQRLMSGDIEIQRGVGAHSFNLPVGERAVPGDFFELRACLVTSGEGRTHFSPTIKAEIARRFDWQLYPVSQWPLRADTAQRINPPLLYPADADATEAKLNMQVVNHNAQPIALRREALGTAFLPVELKPDETRTSEYVFSFPPDTRQVLHPFEIKLSDGQTTELAKVYFVALRKGEAVAFAYDVDQDGFDDYVLESEQLRLVVSPRAGARAFALIDKRTGTNAFTSVGGLRDKFVELDPLDPTRNLRRKRGTYGTFNRPYIAEIIEAMGQRAMLKLSYDAPDVYPGGVRIERTIVLGAGEEFFTVDYRVMPQVPDGVQALWSANSIAVGDPVLQAKRFVAAEGEFAFAPTQTKAVRVSDGWLAAPVNPRATFAVLWRSSEVNAAEVEMKDFSSIVNLKFKPFVTTQPHSFRLAYCLGAWTAGRLQVEQAQILRR